MDASRLGLPTLETRVERWECDFNDHWNARFYARSFQLAAERAATLDGRDNPGLALLAERTIRFHRELFVGAAVEVRSMRIADGAHAGAVAHLLSGGGRLAATAFDLPGAGGGRLPAVPAEALRLVFPRAAIREVDRDPAAADAATAETGPVRPAELDHAGALLVEEIVRRVAYGLHGLLDRLGFTPAFQERTGIGRMAVQTRLVRGVSCGPGALLRVRSRIAGVGGRSFATRHWLETDAGEGVARIDHSLVAVDLRARRAVEMPDFLRRAGEGAGT